MRKLLVLLVVASTQVNAVELTDFRSGLACTDGKSFSWICHETEDIYIDGQGTCTYDKEEYPCTWYGFEFHYHNYDLNEKIECVYENSISMKLGNPVSKESKSVNKGNYSFSLPKENGYFVNPQYSIYKVLDENKENINTDKTTCSYKGEKIFEFRMNHIYPIAPPSE